MSHHSIHDPRLSRKNIDAVAEAAFSLWFIRLLDAYVNCDASVYMAGRFQVKDVFWNSIHSDERYSYEVGVAALELLGEDKCQWLSRYQWARLEGAAKSHWSHTCRGMYRAKCPSIVRYVADVRAMNNA